MQPDSTNGRFTSYAPLRKSRAATVALVVLVWTLLGAQRICAQPDVLTWHNDNQLTGQNLNETVLTPGNVNATNFGLQFSYAVDGYVYAQPLYMSRVPIPGQGTRNVVFVATEHDSVYAFDADGRAPGLFWQKSFINPPAVTTVPNGDVLSSDIVPEVGITGTPVIDGGTGILYVVVKTKETVGGVAHYVQRLHALDVTNGNERLGGPVLIGDTTIGGPDGGYTDVTPISVPGRGNGSDGTTVRFNALRELHRPAMTLTGAGLYISWASHGDNGPYHGWVARYNKNNLALEAVFNTTPNGGLGGIWQSGAGVSVDASGSLYFATGNGTFAVTPTDPCTHVPSPPCNPAYSDSVVKLSSSLSFLDHFTPFNQLTLDNFDADLGSGGTMVLPDPSPGPHPHLLVETGKEGKVYLINRDDLGKYKRCGPTCDDVVQSLAQGITGVWSTPAFFNGRIYYHGSGDVGKAFTLLPTGQFDPTPQRSNAFFGFPGATPSISANGATNGIVWELQTDAFGTSGPAVLHVSNALNIANELYNSNQTGLRDRPGGAVKFTVPTVINGRVYVGTQTSLAVFGLFADAGGVVPAAPSNLTATALTFSSIQLSWTNNATNATGVKIFRSLDGTSFTQIATVNRNTTTFTDTGLAASTVYFYYVQATNQVGDSAPSNTASAKTKILPPTLLVVDVCIGQVSLNWTATADDHYTLERSTDGVNFTLIATVDANTTSFIDTGLALGTYFYRVTAFNQDGDSAVSNTVKTTIGPINTDHSGGFATHSDMMGNGSAQFTVENLLRLNNNFGQRGSAFTVQRMGIRGFSTTFTIRLHEGTQPNIADGLTFTMQNNSPTALGGGGGALGYQGIRNSVAVKFDVFNNEGETDNSTGLFFNGDFPGLPHAPGEVNIPLDPVRDVNLRSQNPKRIDLTYDGTTLRETITDLFTMQTFATSYTVDIGSKVGSDTAFVGFTGGTGGLFSLQDILTWSFTEQEGNIPPRAPNNLQIANVERHDHNRSNITLTWRCENAYTAQGFRLERSTDGTNFTEIATSDVGTMTFTDERLRGGTYFYRVRSFNARGNSGPSNVASLVLGGGDNGVAIDHSAGFASHSELTSNGSASFTGTLARLTDGGFGQAGSAFVGFNSGAGVSNFATTFAFQIRPGTNPMADGMTFVIQGNAPTALGPSGGGLGYGPDNSNNPNRGIRNSVAVKFDIFQNESETDNSTGLFSDGRAPTIPLPGTGDVNVPLDKNLIDLKSTHPFRVDMTYDGTTLSVRITDTVTQRSATQSYTVDIPSKVSSSSNVFFVGFTGGTGGLTAIQDILVWTFQSPAGG